MARVALSPSARKALWIGGVTLLAGTVFLVNFNPASRIKGNPVVSATPEEQVVLPSGTSARLKVALNDKADRSTLRIEVNGQDVTGSFRFRDGAATARVDDLKRGTNEVNVAVEDEHGDTHEHSFSVQASGVPDPQDLRPKLREVTDAILAHQRAERERPNPTWELTDTARLALKALRKIEAGAGEEELDKIRQLDAGLDEQLSALIEVQEAKRIELESQDAAPEALASLQEQEELFIRATEEMRAAFKVAATGTAQDAAKARAALEEMTRGPEEPQRTKPASFQLVEATQHVESFGEAYARLTGKSSGDPEVLLAENVDEPADEENHAVHFGTPTARAQPSDPDLLPSTGVFGYQEPLSAMQDPNDPIVKKAMELNNDPIEIYEFVRNEIEFDLYFGMMRGAHATLLKGAGNDADHAALLVALLRASGYKARFVVGDVLMNSEQAKRWLQIPKSNRMRTVMENMGPWPQEVDIDPNNETPERDGEAFYDHWWVKAYLPYGPDQGRDVNAPKRWIFLDPSFKQHETRWGEDDRPLLELPVSDYDHSFDPGAPLRSVQALTPIELYLNHRLEELRAAHPGKTLADLGLRGPIVREAPGVLPSSLPYQALTYHAEFSEVETLPGNNNAFNAKDRLRPRIVMKLDFPSGIDPTYQIVAADSATTPVTLGWQSHNNTVENHCQGMDLGRCTNPQLVYIKPVLYVGDQQIQYSNVVPLGAPVGIKIGATSVVRAGIDYPTDTSFNSFYSEFGQLPAGSRWALGYHFGQSSRALVDQRIDVLWDKYQSYGLEHAGELNPSQELYPTMDEADFNDLIDELLFIGHLRYQERLYDAMRRLADVEHLNNYTEGFGQAQAKLEVRYFFDTPVAVVRGPFFIDLGMASQLVFVTEEYTMGPRLKMGRLGVLQASALEHQIWEELTQVDSISTVKGIQMADNLGMQVKTYTTSVPGNEPCPSQPHVNQAVADLVSNGYTVTAPVGTIEPADWEWSGCVYWAEESSNLIAAISGAGGAGNGGYTGGFEPFPLVLSTPWMDVSPGSVSTFTGADFTQARMDDPINIVSGNLDHSETDFSIPTRGGRPFAFERTYNSQVPEIGPFGYGWTHTYNVFLEAIDDDVDGALEIDPQGNNTDDDNQTDGVVLVDGRGARHRFSATSGLNGPFVAEQGSRMRLTKEGNELVVRTKEALEFRFPLFGGTAVGTRTFLQSTADPNGNAFTMSHSSPGVLNQVCDPLNRCLTFVPGAGSKVAQVADWSGRTWKYYYVGDDLDYVEQPHAATPGTWTTKSHYEYYSNQINPAVDHNLKRYEDANGNGNTFYYYSNDKAMKRVDDLGAETRFVYDAFRRETAQIDPLGGVTLHQYDKAGQLARIVRPDGTVEDYRHFLAAPDPEFPAYVVDANSAGRLQARIDSLGVMTTYTYDAFGNVKSETVAVGTPNAATTTYTYYHESFPPLALDDPRHNLVVNRVDPRGTIFGYLYDDYGNPNWTGVHMDPDGDGPESPRTVELSRHWYDAYGNRTWSVTNTDAATGADPLPWQGNPDLIQVFEYSPDRTRLVRIETWDGDVDYEWDVDLGEPDRGLLRRVTVDRSAVYPDRPPQFNTLTREFVYDVLGRRIQDISPSGTTVFAYYDAAGRVTSRTIAADDAAGEQQARNTFYTYDANNQLTTQTDHVGNKTKLEYDLLGNRVRTIDANGRVTETVYDAMSRPVVSVDANGERSRIVRDGVGRPIQLIDPLGNTVEQVYDDAGRLVETAVRNVIDPAEPGTPQDIVTTFSYDANGNRTGVRDPRLNAGDTSATVDPVSGDLTETVGAVSNAEGNTSTSEYDELNRLVLVRNAYGDETKFEYDLHGNTTKITDARGNDTIQVFGRTGRMESRTTPAGTETFTYDTSGNLISKLDRNGERTDYFYNFDDLQLTIVYNDGREETVGFDGFGQPVLERSPEVTYTNAYDEVGRLTRRTDSRFGSALRFTYDNIGNLLSQTDLEGNVTQYRYDDNNRLIAIGIPGQGEVERHYDQAGRLVAEYLPSEVYTHYVYDNASRVTQIATVFTGAESLEYEYTYDENGNVTVLDRDGHGLAKEELMYDALNRLVEMDPVDYSDIEERFAYDAVGNRIYHCKGDDCDNGASEPGGELWLEYDDANRLHTIKWDDDGNTVLTVRETRAYDANGNTTGKIDLATGDVWAYDYDGANRLVSVSEAVSGNSWRYAFDTSGHRVLQDSSQGVREYAWMGGNRVGEYTDAGFQASAVFGPGLDDIIARTDSGGTRYLHQRAGQTVVAETDAAGGLSATYAYTPFGELSSAPPATHDFGYTGRERDSNGLMYYRARFYDPAVGRFMNEDPSGFAGSGTNLYGYVENSPLSLVDATGQTSTVAGLVTPVPRPKPGPAANTLFGYFLPATITGPGHLTSYPQLPAPHPHSRFTSSVTLGKVSGAFGNGFSGSLKLSSTIPIGAEAEGSLKLTLEPKTDVTVQGFFGKTFGFSAKQSATIESRFDLPDEETMTIDVISPIAKIGIRLADDGIRGFRLGGPSLDFGLELGHSDVEMTLKELQFPGSTTAGTSQADSASLFGSGSQVAPPSAASYMNPGGC